MGHSGYHPLKHCPLRIVFGWGTNGCGICYMLNGKGPEYRSTRQTLIVYINEFTRTLLSERETKMDCDDSTATMVKWPPGIKSGQP